ncbi:MAG: right-handed parallel beta-helix repeat-containing protein [Microbacterium arborescens]
MHIYDSASVRAVGFTVQNVRKGVSVSTGSDIVVSDLSVRNIGEEAIHLRYDTTDSVVSNNSISYTGLTGPLYGEGVYVGTDPKNWCKFTDCRPDRSDRNAVYGNTIWGTPVEGIEAKAGTSNGLIADNVVNGTSTRDQYSGISVKGNEWVIEDNRVTGVRTRAISVQDSSSEGWGYDSVLSRNTVSSDSDGVGIWATARLRNIVSCDNVNTTQGAALSNLACQK